MSIKVKDLRAELAKFPDDTIVLVEGYEGGLSDIGVINQSKLNLM